MLELRKHGLETLAWKARPRRDREPRQLEDLVRLLPREEVGELVGADHEDRIVELLRAQEVDRRGYGSRRTSSSGNAARARSRRVCAGRSTSLCAGRSATRTTKRRRSS